MKRRILVIDDSVITLQIVGATLREAGYDVRTSSEVENLVGTFGEWRPDVILTDVNMPSVSGVELCRRLKSEYDTADVPVVLYSSLADRDLEVLARECEADAFISKQSGQDALPLELERLFQTTLF